MLQIIKTLNFKIIKKWTLITLTTLSSPRDKPVLTVAVRLKPDLYTHLVLETEK